MLQIYEINPRLSFISQFFFKNIGNSLFVIMTETNNFFPKKRITFQFFLYLCPQIEYSRPDNKHVSK